MIQRLILAVWLLTASLWVSANAAGTDSSRLRVAIVQMVQAPTLAANRDRILAGIAEAARRDPRVIVFPEESLMGQGSDDLTVVGAAVAAIRRAAQEKGVYVMFGAATRTKTLTKNVNWMLVIGPDGRDVFRYEKLYDQPTAPMPGVFNIEGIPCNAIICADRWLRGVEEVPIQQGAKVSFELSCNSAIEWVAPFEWYWYVPRAVRNNVWVIFANMGNTVSGEVSYPGAHLRHGHSAIIAPDGRMVAGAKDDVATILVEDIDVRESTRAEALARSRHPALRGFWEAGLKRQAGQEVAVAPFTPLKSPSIDITIAAAQSVNDLPAMEAKIREAHVRKADIVVFPARAASEAELLRVQTAARENAIVVVFGAEHRVDGRTWNSAFVIGPDGTLLTRYDQVSATKPYEAGSELGTMWFRVKGVSAVVTIGRDGLWSELSELAAAAGAQIHVHLDHDRAVGSAALFRQQVWCNLASFQTFSATVNVIDCMIWDDLRSFEERRAPAGERLAGSDEAEVYSQFSANLVARTQRADDLLVVTRHVNPANLYHSRSIVKKNPQMEAWYRYGAASLQPK